MSLEINRRGNYFQACMTYFPTASILNYGSDMGILELMAYQSDKEQV